MNVSNYEIRLGPSREATFRVFDWGSKAATGDRSIGAMARWRASANIHGSSIMGFMTINKVKLLSGLAT